MARTEWDGSAVVCMEKQKSEQPRQYIADSGPKRMEWHWPLDRSGTHRFMFKFVWLGEIA